ncbi:sigma-70 family RNA polymerase sigma factor [Rhizocola hellebori]|nr:sigma-70 family RNA polymerase sigma factor [Rhizocola hellebori]
MLEPELESDPYLISLVRGGDTEAFGRLYERHVAAARRLARVLTRDPSDADDLVAETFTRVLSAMRTGHGPDTAFRAYLLTSLRHTLYDRASRDRRIEYTDDLTAYERPNAPEDPAVRTLESTYAARAFARLPERWRAVLWHTEVEGESAAQVAPLLGLTPNGVAALAYRARERLRQMYLQEHIAITESPRCHWTGTHLAGYVRAALARRDRSKVEDHLTECHRCRALHRELSEENSGLRSVIAGLLLGGAAPAYLAEGSPLGARWLATIGAGILLWGKGWLAQLAAIATELWWRVLSLPRSVIQRYGPGNVAAAGGLAGAGLIGVAVFTGVLLQSTPQQHAAPPRVPPLPRPVQPPPTGAAQLLPPPQLSAPPPVLLPLEPTPAQTKPAQTKPAPAPAQAGSAVIAFEPAQARLTAMGSGTLPITVRMAESSAMSSDALSLGVLVPAPMKLAGPDAGDGWRCQAGAGTVMCERAGPVRNGMTTAKIPLEVGNLTGYQGFDVTLKAGSTVTRSMVRAPIAPAGLDVGYAAHGHLGYALGGNTLLACQPRPTCLSSDNNSRAMLPALPVDREPGAPKGLLAAGGPSGPSGQLVALAGGKAASGAHLRLPAGARVRWAGLTITASASAPPVFAGVHTPRGGWYPIKLNPSKNVIADRAVSQSFAEVTDLVRADGGGDWWLATAADDLPSGLGQFAGWSLAVVYDSAASADGELAVYLGPKPLRWQQEVSVQLGAGGKVDVGLVVWDGDRALSGDSLVVGKNTVGDPGNVAGGSNASAVACTATPDQCAWPTPGLDVLRFRGSADVGATTTLLAGEDPLELGVLAVLTETAQAGGRAVASR